MIRKTLRFFIKCAIWFFALSIVWVLYTAGCLCPIPPLMAIRYFESDKNYENKHDWVALDAISKELQLAVICSEDQNFVNHHGFDFNAIEKAYKNNKGESPKRRKHHFPTNCKNIFLWPGQAGSERV